MTAQVSRNSRRSSTVVLYSATDTSKISLTILLNLLYIWTILGVGSGRSISGWLSKIDFWLGPNHVIGMLPYMVILSTFLTTFSNENFST